MTHPAKTHRLLLASILLVFLPSGLLPAQQQLSDGSEVCALALSGELDSLRAGLAAGRWRGSQEVLATAVLEGDGLLATDRFEQVLSRPGSTPAQRALAASHLYSHHLLLGDGARANEMLAIVRESPEVAALAFPSGLPDQAPVVQTAWAVQIGAFSNRTNAENLAREQRRRGYTVTVQPITSAGRTLHAVRVGRFDSERAARQFGERAYSAQGKPFRAVELELKSPGSSR